MTTPALAVVAALAGTVGVWSAGAAALPAASPAAITRPALTGGHGALATPAGARLLLARTAVQPAQLDSVLAVSAGKPDTRAHASITSSGKARKELTPRQIARRLLARFGWSQRQFPALNYLWSRESSWNKRAENLYSGAYGIPQAVPGSKMSTAGSHWRTSARTQILWGLSYIKSRYGSPRAAWDHELATGWY